MAFARSLGTLGVEDPRNRFPSTCDRHAEEPPPAPSNAREVAEEMPVQTTKPGLRRPWLAGPVWFLHTLRGSGAGVAAWRGRQLTAHTRPATDRKQRGAALGTVALPTGATVGQSYRACVGNRDLCSADASTLRSGIGWCWLRVGHTEQHIRRGLKDHPHCPRIGAAHRS